MLSFEGISTNVFYIPWLRFVKEIESGVVNVERKDDGSSLESGDNYP